MYTVARTSVVLDRGLSLALFVEGLCVMEMLKSAVHLIELFWGEFFLKLHLTFKNKLHSFTLCFWLWNLSYWCEMGCYYYITHKQLLILQSFNSGASDSKVSCTYLSWKVCGCHYHQYLNTSQTTGKHILLHLFKGIRVTIHTLHIRKITLHVWGQWGCWAKARNAVWFFWFPLPQRKRAWSLGKPH